MKRLVAIFSAITLVAELFFVAPPARALDCTGATVSTTGCSASTDLNVILEEAIQLAIGNCGTVTARTVSLVAYGGFSSCRLDVEVGTNAPGFKLFIQSVDLPTYSLSATNGSAITGTDYTNPYFDGSTNGSTNLVLMTPSKNTSVFIPPSAATIAAPAVMSGGSAWGFAVPTTMGSNAAFDAAYTAVTNSAPNGKYAGVPTTPAQIRAHTGTTNGQNTEVYFGSNVATTQAPGTYNGTVLFSVIGEAPAAPGGQGDNIAGNPGETGGFAPGTVTRTPAAVGTGSYDGASGQLTTSTAFPLGVTEMVTRITEGDSANALTAIAAIALLGVLAWMLFILLGRRYKVFLTAVSEDRAEVVKALEIVKKYVKKDKSDREIMEAISALSIAPLLVKDKLFHRKAVKIKKALEDAGAKAKIKGNRKHKKRKK